MFVVHTKKKPPQPFIGQKDFFPFYISKSVCCYYILPDNPARLQSTKVKANQTKKSTESKAWP